MSVVVLLTAAFVLLTTPAARALLPSESAIRDVSVSRAFFNPSLGQKIHISLTAGESGRLNLWILDRDGYLVRKLVSNHLITTGKVGFDWDGRDDRGAVVPDEAYSMKIDLVSSSGASSFFPANAIPEMLNAGRALYDRSSGVVSYKLPVPARVHIQAGSARTNQKTGRAEGPVLKTIANREPRTAGSVIDAWNGWDESGTVRVCDLPNFAIAVAASPLPDQAIITVGNRGVTFFDWVGKRTGSSLLTVSTADHSHHRGLSSLEDVAPQLLLKPHNANWSEAERIWLTADEVIRLDASLVGPTAKAFAANPGKVMVFLDLKNVSTRPAGSAEPIVVSTEGLTAGPHRITVNWVSDYGPVAVNTVLFRNEKAAPTRTAVR
jgi:flagellar hook assembly protein FlgD